MKTVKEYFFITLGVLLVAAGVQFFFAPNKIAAGGVIGIAIVINNYIPSISIGNLTLIMNIILFIVGFVFIGGKFGGKTIYSSLSLAAIIGVMERIPAFNVSITDDLFLASVFGVLISGIGMGIVFNQNASTGGTDILAKILNKFVHIDIGKSLLIVDFTVTVFAGISFNAEIGMYSLICVILNGVIIDGVIDGLNMCKQVMVISSKNDLIRDYIIKELERGCTIFDGKGAYTGKDTFVLYTVLSRKEFIKLRGFIKDIDRRAFITVGDVHEVLGEGFKDIVE